MTDKQINYEQNSVIIDDIDVSECVYYKATGKYNTCGYYCEQNPNCYYKQFKRSEAQCEVMFVLHTDLEKRYKAKEQECEELKKYLNQIRDEELLHLDIEWDEYETSARQEDYSNIITLVERALGEIDD